LRIAADRGADVQRAAAAMLFAQRLNLVWVMALQEFRPRNAREGQKIFWVILDPVGQMAVLMVIFEIIGRMASYGRSFALFLMTGVVILTLFRTGSSYVSTAVYRLKAPARPPAVGAFHEALSKTLFNLVIAVIYTTVLMWGIGVVQHLDTTPVAPLLMVDAFLWTAALALGVGLVIGYASLFVKPVEKIYGILARGLLFVSGVFYVPSFMPPALRDLLAWNPVLHGVELMRLGVYGTYPSIVYSPFYFKGFALGAIVLGMLLVWSDRRRILG
jgi:capsular polysaccharide transport system permease protein